MKIRKLHLKNIGVFDDEEIVFQPSSAKDKAEIHIFTGQNGSGKSTVLMTLASCFDDIQKRDGLARAEHFEYARNELYKRFKKFDYSNENYLSTADILFDDNDSLKLFGCPTCKSIHYKEFFTHDYLKSVHRQLERYRGILSNPNRYDSSDFWAELEFAAFAFSGYRYVDYERVEAIKEPSDFNPLSQSLNFIKDYSKSNQITINQLIANNISKSGIEYQRGNFEKSEKFTRTVTTIEQIISEITGWKVEFDLQTEPTNLVTKINGKELDFDVLPDGLRSLISWIADLLGKVDLLKWEDNSSIFEKNLILLLDEIEIHLHPAWQRKVLPVVQKLFKNSQIFISTHSPFVINSVDDAWVYKLELENGKARVSDVVKSEDGFSYRYVLREIFGITEQFGVGVQKDLDKFYELRDKVLENGSKTSQKDFLKLAKALAEQSEELNRIVQSELRQISEMKGKEFSL